MEKLAVSHNARRLPLDVFLMGFKLMKLCTLEMILESVIEGKDTHRKRIRNKLCVPGGQNLYTYLKNYEF